MGLFGKEDIPRSSNSATDPAADLLEALGYTQQLDRTRSTLAVTFMAFVLASVPYGLSTTLIYPLLGGGPSTIIWGWILVCCLMICVAVSLAEITSVRCVLSSVERSSLCVPIYVKIVNRGMCEHRSCLCVGSRACELTVTRSTHLLEVCTTRHSCFHQTQCASSRRGSRAGRLYLATSSSPCQ